jgi:hypothetical protein
MFEIISAVVIPFVVQLLKKIKLPSRLAPIAAVILAILIVAGAKILGSDLDIGNIYEAILKVLGISGMSILGYDVLKKTVKNK